jgi:hypothetical protein
MRISNPPDASSLMATARSFGNYDLAAALADLIDNSIRAEAKKVSIIFQPVEKDVVVRIRDDGIGMTRNELVAAMRPASANPEDPRELNDLGRFGWGLKSASLSQARVLSVVSWRGSECTAAIWDIDNLENWSMELLVGEEAFKLLESSPISNFGTEVIWNRCDRLLDQDISSSLDEQLNEKISHASKQLSLIFHRYLSGEVGGKFVIEMQGYVLKPVDPFMTQHPATQTVDEDIIKLRGKEEIAVQPFIIPHFSKLTVDEREMLGGDEGLVRNQGFYVYRNKRLIIYGTWFRLMPHGELSQLMRVRVDLPNTLDKDWKITLDKSDAQLPVVLRTGLKELLRKFGKRSASANRKKGVDLTIDKKEPVWKRVVYNGRIRYQINRDHPFVWELIAESQDSEITREALKLIESYVPTESMIKDREINQLEQVQAITDPEIFEALIDACFMACLRQTGRQPTLKEFLEFAIQMEPFSSQWKYSESYIKNNIKEKWGLV